MPKRSVHSVAYGVPLPDRELLLPHEVAAWLRVEPATVSRWVKSGELTGTYTPGGHVRVRRDVVIAKFTNREE